MIERQDAADKVEYMSITLDNLAAIFKRPLLQADLDELLETLEDLSSEVTELSKSTKKLLSLSLSLHLKDAKEGQNVQ